MGILCKSLVSPHQTRCTSYFYSGAIWWIFLLIKYVMQGNDKDAKLMWLNHVNLVWIKISLDRNKHCRTFVPPSLILRYSFVHPIVNNKVWIGRKRDSQRTYIGVVAYSLPSILLISSSRVCDRGLHQKYLPLNWESEALCSGRQRGKTDGKIKFTRLWHRHTTINRSTATCLYRIILVVNYEFILLGMPNWLLGEYMTCIDTIVAVSVNSTFLNFIT